MPHHTSRSISPVRAYRFAAVPMLLAAIATAAPVPKDGADPFRRLGGPDRLVEIRALETRQFGFAQMEKLASWSGEPITKETLDGRVLVVLAWDQSEARSVRLVPTLSRLERTMGDRAVCLAVHAQDGWADAKDRIDAGRVPVTTAHDADGSFFKMLGTDEHPNVYIVDRSGRVRLADLDPRDLTRAVGVLSRETPEEAQADLPRRIERLAEARRLLVPDPQPGTDMPNPDGTLRPGQPAVPGGPVRAETPGSRSPELPPMEAMPRPPAGAYTAAAWPPINTDGVNALDVQGKRLPVALGNETWLSDRPERALNEHVLVLDFWATWCGPCIRASPTLDRLQTRHARDLIVMGMAGQAAGTRYPEDERSIRAHMASHPVSYSHLIDPQQRVFKSLRITGIPHVVVISTDGVVRWQGNPLDSEFRQAVDAVVLADPLLAARRAQRPSRGNGKPNG